MENYIFNMDIFEAVNKKIGGNCGNQLKIMYVLIGTMNSECEHVSHEYLMTNAKLSKQQYRLALSGLYGKGFIVIDVNTVKPNFENIMK